MAVDMKIWTIENNRITPLNQPREPFRSDSLRSLVQDLLEGFQSNAKWDTLPGVKACKLSPDGPYCIFKITISNQTRLVGKKSTFPLP